MKSIAERVTKAGKGSLSYLSADGPGKQFSEIGGGGGCGATGE
jgi:hypothetical protein